MWSEKRHKDRECPDLSFNCSSYWYLFQSVITGMEMTTQKWTFPTNDLCCLHTFESNQIRPLLTQVLLQVIFIFQTLLQNSLAARAVFGRGEGKRTRGTSSAKVTSAGCFSCHRQPLLRKLLASPAPSCGHVSTASNFLTKICSENQQNGTNK